MNIFKNHLSYATLHKKDGCYFVQPVTIMVTGWSYPIKNKIIMNGEVTYGYEKKF
ncbi:hypothetical protein B4077_4058 [Bacillus cereus]|uniref:Uncharacterized protein n=1 Tax=Bacillus cereus TaxID=1396 RepID=A0A0G8F2S0_BACCE|nr:hypothetical protein B4077_4058 [Bacillus cereus]